MSVLQNYRQFDGIHWETGTVRNYYDYCAVKAPHTGQPYSEALLMGISGGVVMGYFVFAYKGYDPHARILTRNTFDPMETMLQRLGVVQEIRQTASADKAVANLVDVLTDGTPAITWVDVFRLPYDPQPYEWDIWHMLPVIVFGYDADADIVSIADRARVPLTVSMAELAAARARVKKTKYRIVTLDMPDPEKLPMAVQMGIRDCIRLYTEKPPKGARHNFGFAAYQRWADDLCNPRRRGSWAKEFPAGRKMYAGLESVFTDINIFGKEGYAERDRYADFLDEAAVLLEKPLLREAAAQFRRSAQAWDELSQILLADSVPVWAEARERMLCNQRLFLEQGNAALAEGKANAERLLEIRRQMETDFPLTDAEVTAYRARIAEHVLRVRDIEEPAIAMMKETMATMP